MNVLLAGRLARGGALEEGWIEMSGERIIAAGTGTPPRPPDEVHRGIVAPGLCDLQVNGAAGHEVTDGSSALDAIDAIQLDHGVTSYLPTVVSMDDAHAEEWIAALAERVADPSSPVAGAHLEGPFLSQARAGMHPVSGLRSPADGVPDYFFADAVRLVTIAPELPGALDLIAQLSARGTAVSLGHSEASAPVAMQALDRGARCITHVFNGMAPLHHRAPGLVGVALADIRPLVGVIADGLHVDPLALELVRRSVGPRVVLVSDATPAAAAPAGDYTMAGIEIRSKDDGRVSTAEGRLAGTAITVDDAVRNWASMTGASLPDALAAAAEVPAALLGIDARLDAGSEADIVLLDDEGAVQRVMRRGRWVR
jgi:N-acetylglucosamine-6-phosphate deacetylase